MKPLNPNRKVYVYRNLRNNCLSIQQDGIIVGYAEAVILTDVEFRVRESGRQRALREKHKNVHAFAIGKVEDVFGYEKFRAVAPQKIFETTGSLITYNPYLCANFYNRKTRRPVFGGKRVLVTTTQGIYVED